MTVGSYEAKTKLPSLLKRVEMGEKITITRHGVAIAVLAPPERSEQERVMRAKKAVEDMKQFRKEFIARNGRGLTLAEIKEAINEGRR